ncbi:hypothetical protein SAMN05216355_10536 [Actinomyces ruminicola]|uniref:Uncharacterized protein n=1 Tax=Actinomyces ruminicola TaxID=332524 RepID=A0A1H0BVN7_9ACTO|nr:hypothetical protein [Actinomyces ruminicola]SDN49709.1 hypothetical protein SAMN05216355_10536 [Actinomyces ruminicola]
MSYGFGSEPRHWPGQAVDLDAIIGRLRSLGRELERQRETEQERFDQQEEERARMARSGELGEDWRRIQSRIDAGQTTIMDVLSGADRSPEARHLREQAERNMRSLRSQWREQQRSGRTDTPLDQMDEIRDSQGR